MKKPFPPPIRSNRRKLSVEVYFVLYLTAIILLLGTAPLSKERYDAELEEAIAQLINTDFEIDVENIALIVPFVPAGMIDSTGVDLRRDTVNVIRARGSFSRVGFRIVAIEDTLTGQSLPIETASLVRNGDSSVLFSWNQGERKQAAIYRIKVAADARPIIPASVSSPALRERIEAIISRRNTMRDTAIFSVNVVPVTSPEYLLAVKQAPLLNGGESTQLSTSPLDLAALLAQARQSTGQAYIFAPSFQTVMSPPGKTWSQRLNVSGADGNTLLLKFPPGVRPVAKGTNYIDIIGTAPASGEAQIKVTARLPDGTSPIETMFIVSTTTLPDPKGLPSTIYFSKTYSPDFSANGIDDSRISVEIIENGNRVSGKKGAFFSYSPSIQSGDVEFIRYVDGNVVSRSKARVTEYPKPTIRLVDADNDDQSVTVETITYGEVNGLTNTATLRIQKGQNASDPEQIGSTQADPSTGQIRMKWKISPKNSSKDLTFTLIAWDRRGPTYATTLPIAGR